MFTTAQSPTQTYTNVGIETGVMSANPHKLILMLFEGALTATAKAQHAMQKGRTAEKGEAISKAIDIIANGLKASLDTTAGGELTDRLGALYEYMCHRLLHANLRNDRAAIEEVSRLLRELKEAWGEIASDPAAVSGSKRAA